MLMQVTYSPHDGGYYAEVWNILGVEIGKTRVYQKRAQAEKAASRIIARHHEKAQRDSANAIRSHRRAAR
jgi:hypothetical protein